MLAIARFLLTGSLPFVGKLRLAESGTEPAVAEETFREYLDVLKRSGAPAEMIKAGSDKRYITSCSGQSIFRPMQEAEDLWESEWKHRKG